MTSGRDRPAPLAAVLAVTFTASLSGGVFWAAIFFLTAGHYRFSAGRNLVLAAAMGAVYAATAAAPGVLVRRLSASSSPRAVLMAALAAWTIAAIAAARRAAFRGRPCGARRCWARRRRP